jgi:hypothetical protein
MDQKFHGDDEKNPRIWILNLAQWPTAIIRPKSRNSNIRHDGILSMGNFMLMIHNNLLKIKNNVPHGIYYLCEFVFVIPTDNSLTFISITVNANGTCTCTCLHGISVLD